MASRPVYGILVNSRVAKVNCFLSLRQKFNRSPGRRSPEALIHLRPTFRKILQRRNLRGREGKDEQVKYLSNLPFGPGAGISASPGVGINEFFRTGLGKGFGRFNKKSTLGQDGRRKENLKRS